MSPGTVHILLIGHDPNEFHAIEDLLVRLDVEQFQLEHASTLDAGLQHLAEGAIEVCLLDLSLPGHRDLEALNRVTTHAPDVPVVVLFDPGHIELAIRAMEQGAQEYLVKGQTSLDTLLRAMRHAVERHRMLKAFASCLEQLQNSEARFRSVTENSPDGILLVDHDSFVRFVNPAAEALLRRKAEELVGSFWGFRLQAGESVRFDVVHPDGKAAAHELQTVVIPWEGQDVYLVFLRPATSAEIPPVESHRARMQWQAANPREK